MGGAAAFVAPVAPAAGTALNGKEEMVALAESNPDLLGRTIGFWDPFNLIAEGDFWGLGNEATIGYLRHAEIKHGRVAMAAFLGFIVQSLPVVSGEHWFAPYRGYVAGVSPQEQWDNVPAIGKLQILVAIGMLESYGEGAGNPEGYVHYCNGGLPGYFPPIAGRPASARLASTSTTPSTGSTPPTPARTRPAGARSRSTTAASPCSASSRCSPSRRRPAPCPRSRSSTTLWMPLV